MRRIKGSDLTFRDNLYVLWNLTMGKKNIAVCMCALLLLGCAKYKELTRLKKFDDLSMSYEHAIRWSDFDYAAAFVRDPESEEKSPDPEIVKLVRVTNYKVKRTAISPDEKQIAKIVEISYYRSDTMIVNTITEQELWEWDDENQRWDLKSGLPDFK
jgi:hypothetical protein